MCSGWLKEGGELAWRGTAIQAEPSPHKLGKGGLAG